MKRFLLVVSLICFAFLHSYAQKKVTGQVKERGSVLGLPGVTVQVKDGINSTITDYEGFFEIEVPEGKDILIFSLEGYGTKEIELGNRSSVDVTLVKESDQKEGDVQVGYGSLSKEEMTSSVSSIDQDKLGTQPVVDLEQANQGRAAGVFIQNSGGKLGQGTRVRIRGGSSLSGSNEPLYVVDGVPLTSDNQSDIDPTTIESIEILKDASAAALYGSRAANGVVLITTKKGTAGKLKLDLDYQFGISTTPKRLDMMSPEEYRIMFFEFTLRSILEGLPQPDPNLSLSATNLGNFISQENLSTWYNDLLNLRENATDDQISYTFPQSEDEISMSVNNPIFRNVYNTDWQDQAFRTAQTNRASLNLSGGSENHRVFTNFSYLNQEGILIGNDYERINGRINVNSQFTSKFSTSLTASYIRTNNNQVNEDADIGNPLQMILLPPADAPDPENDYVLRVRSLEYNPQTEVFNSDYLEVADRINSTLAMTYDFSGNLSLNVDGGIDFSDVTNERRQGPPTFEGRPNGLSRLSTSKTMNYIFNGYLSYNSVIGNSKISAILGSSYQKSETEFTFRSARINSISELKDLDESEPSLFNPPIPGSAFSFLSYYTRINYTLAEKYTFQLSGRADGSSKFGEDNRYGFFPAVSAGWNISNEDFLADNRIVSFLKLKGSYGIVGNTPQDDFLYRRNYFPVFYGNTEGLRLSNFSNSALRWESTAQLDVGIDFGVFDNRISGSVNYYNKQTTDLLFPVPVSLTSGFGNVLKNVGSLTNSGIEFALSTVNFERDRFFWTTEFNISTNNNEVTDIGGERLIQGINAFIEGQPPGVFYMVEYTGVRESDGQALYDLDGANTENYNLALENGRKVVGDPNSDFYGGFLNNITYGNFDLSFIFQFVQGVDIYWETGEFISNSGFALYGQTADQVDRWYQPGDETDIPVLSPVQENTNPSTRWLVDGSYIRLNNVSLSYNLPTDLVSKMGLRYFRVYIGGQNLLTISDYPGYDPDVGYVDPNGGIIAQNINRGIDFFTAPQPRVYTTGIKIGF